MTLGKMFPASAVLLAASALSAVAWGQEPARAATPVWRKKPALTFQLGSYFSNLGTTIRVDGEEGPGTLVDISDILKIPPNATVVRVRGDVRLASWFAIDAEYYRIGRSKTTVIDEQIVVGDVVYSVDETVTTRHITSYLDVALKFYLIRRPRLDLGLWAGANVQFLKFSLEAVPSELGVVQKDTWLPIPAVGAHFSYTILPRLYLNGKGGLFLFRISDSLKFESARLDVSLDYFVWKSLGIGVTYAFSNSNVELARISFRGVVRARASGLQVFGLIGF